MTTLTVANQKGGVGKTTTAVTLAHGLALSGCQVLLVDLDPQGQCAVFLGQPPAPGAFALLVQKLPLRQLIHQARPNLWLLPSDHTTAHAGVILSTLNAPISALKQALLGSWDWIIIDTAPSISNLQAQALYASHYVLVPTACDFASVQGITNLEGTMLQLQQTYLWPGQLLGILPTFYDSATLETQAMMMELIRLYQHSLIHPIHRATALRESCANGQTILEYLPTSRAALEYARLVNHIKKFQT
jgi:chromosome partitioning protein